jgi:hypothetical protein
MLLSDQSAQAIDLILAHRLEGLDLGDENIHPHYSGHSILNLPTSLSKWLGAEPLPHPGIDMPELEAMASGVDQVIVTLIDAVSLSRFQAWMADMLPVHASAPGEAILTTLTSVVPSTTCAALTSLWTGRSPAEHGILGYEIFLREFGLVANMITHEPAAFHGEAGSLYRAGLDPLTFLPVPTMGPHLAAHGVETHAHLHYSLSGSGLSRMHYPDVNVRPYAGVSDLWISVRQLAEAPLSSKRYLWVYYGGVDGLSHRYGPDSPQAKADFEAFVRGLFMHFLEPLDPQVGKRTLFVMLADHGQVTTRKDPHYELGSHPGLARRLHMSPTGENRLAYLYPRPGQTEAVDEYVQRTWPAGFLPLSSGFALDSGLFGPGEPAATARDRLGDIILVSQGEAYLWWAAKENPLIGRHGGLSRDEMLVPLFAYRRF